MIEIGSIADWVGAVGGITSAGSAVGFYWLDRRRYTSERIEAAVQHSTEQSTILVEFKGLVQTALEALDAVQNSDRNEDSWQYLNGMLRNHAIRMRELMAASDGGSDLHLKIGKAAHVLAFSNLPLAHMNIWEHDAKKASESLRDVLNDSPTACKK